MVRTLSTLTFLLDNDYLIIETDDCETGWGGALFRNFLKHDPETIESLCGYVSGKFKEKVI